MLFRSEEHDRLPAIVCLVVASSGVSVVGIGAAFWALAAGLVVRAVLPGPTAPKSDRASVAP